ncbi:flagellar motor switch protein FliG [uncultured Alsobacter sp.]|uniref:flagellar motor switch protein FliG n=1 Tax=uncultured Alsobacter sp. TaxID=1748258 RepID=UPI0025F8DA4A|nr:flagellar motor switch protein FliG [uncultured Alsobacter sp.]
MAITGMTMTNRISGPERAAVLLLTLGETYGSQVWSHLDEEEIRIITGAMTQLGVVAPEQVKTLMEEFVQSLNVVAVTGDHETTERLLRKLLPDSQVEQIMDGVRGPAGRSVWQKLSNVPDVLVANYLKNEHPQTSAVVLSRMGGQQVAKILALLSPDLAVDIIHRMVHLDEIPKKTLESIEATLRAEFINAIGRGSRRDRIGQLADVFNFLDKTTEAALFAELEELDPHSAAKIRSRMFTFEGLLALDPAGIQTLIRACDTRVLAQALKGASPALTDVFMRNMSKRAGRMLEEELTTLGPMRLRLVDEAQQKVVTLARELERKGDIIIPKGGHDEVIL